MKRSIRFVGLDVHAKSIAVAVAESGRNGEVRFLGTIANEPEAVRKWVKRLGPAGDLHVCYEAGPCGYALYWLLTSLDVACDVIAPNLIPKKAGDKVKTDRRDAENLARCLRAGELTSVWVPDLDHEALRDLVRTREAAKADQVRARHRVGKFLLRKGLRRPEGMAAWGTRHMEWLQSTCFKRQPEQAAYTDLLAEVHHANARIERLEKVIDEAIENAPVEAKALIDGLQALRGVAKMTAVTIATEMGRASRFPRPRQLMGYTGVVSSEASSGEKTRRGRITRSGNAHLRRVVVEAAWASRFRPALGKRLRAHQSVVSAEIGELAWKAQVRLHARYRRLLGRGVLKQKVVTAVARELLGFIWAIGMQVEREQSAKKQQQKAA